MIDKTLWSEAVQLRELIAAMNAERDRLYAKRTRLMRRMAKKGMTHREIAAAFLIKQPLVTLTLQRN